VFTDKLSGTAKTNRLDLPGYGVVHRGRQREGDRPPIKCREMRTVAELQGQPQGFAVEQEGFVEVVVDKTIIRTPGSPIGASRG
jgi:hypothetical protein